jgi:hypothetical protein
MAQEPVDVKQQLEKNLDDGFATLISRVKSLDLSPSKDGTWGPFEVVSHLAGWHFSAADRLRSLGAGEQVDSPGGADEVNEGFVAERAHLSAAQLVEQLEESFGEMRHAVAQAPASIFWHGGHGGPGHEHSLAYFIAYENGTGHYKEHAADLGLPA